MSMPDREAAVRHQESAAVQEWLLAILRFAVTLNGADRAAILATAGEMDRRGSGFTFFVRMSVKLADAIVARDRADARAILRVFIRRMDCLLLRRAFEAVLCIKPPGADRRTISARSREMLWQGLPTRGTGTV
jgi:hypothetical protein